MDLQRKLSLIDVPVDWIGLRYVSEASTYRSARNGRPEENQRNSTQGIMVEVLVDGQFAYAATSRLDPASLQQAAMRAADLARAAAAHAVFAFDSSARPPSSGIYRSPFILAQDAITPADINELLLRASERLQVSAQIVSAETKVMITETEFCFVSTNASQVEQQFLLVSMDNAAIAQQGAEVQRRSDGGFLAKSYQAGLELLDMDAILARCDLIGEQAVELLGAEECPDRVMDLLLAPDQMMLQIHESVGHPLEIDRILGDERNFAGCSFVGLEDFGTLKYGSELMNITFDPNVRGEFASYGFDDGGALAKRTHLIENGILKRGLGGIESQQRSGVGGVANFRASGWNRAPIDRMANLNLEPGSDSFQDIVADVEYGVYMTANRSWSIDDYRNKFQFGCEYAQLIENGQLTRTLRNPNYRGVSTPFWNNLSRVGDRDSFAMYGTPYCGKGEPNQLIRVGHAAPVCLFTDIQVFGGA